MFWQEEETQKTPEIAQQVSDVAFALHCRCLPVDHAYLLSQALRAALPWLMDEPLAGIHLVHGAESGNGWQRPENQSEMLYLSRRTKLVLRLPNTRLEAVNALQGEKLLVGNYLMQLGKVSVKPLQAFPVLFARHVVSQAGQDEETFLHHTVAELNALGVTCRKVLCGKTTILTHPNGDLITRSLMVADLRAHESRLLQQQGVGNAKLMGCGLFLPHKDIKAVDPEASQS